MNGDTQLSGNIPALELHHWLDSGKPLMLLDVMGEESFSEQHIPSAQQACVYESSFIDQVKKLNSDLGASVVVYGTSEASLASQVAAQKLKQAGYTHVYDLRGGLAEWKSAGLAVSGSVSIGEVQTALNGVYMLDVEKSVVRWTGRNLLNHHEGTLRFSEGRFEVKNDSLVSAEFSVDMNSIACSDLTDQAWNEMLVRHLKDADFFEVSRWPVASFKATSSLWLDDVTQGLPNCQITGELDLRGVTQEIQFNALVGSQDGLVLGAPAVLDLDRTRWGAIYGSGRYFDKLGKHLVNDIVHLHIKIVAEKRA